MNFVNEDITFDTLRTLLISEAEESNAAKEAHKRGLVAGGRYGDWLDPITGELRGRTGPDGEFVEMSGYGTPEDPDEKKKKQADDEKKKVDQTDMFGGSSDSGKTPDDTKPIKPASTPLPKKPSKSTPKTDSSTSAAQSPPPAAYKNTQSFKSRLKENPNFIKEQTKKLAAVFSTARTDEPLQFFDKILEALDIPDVEVSFFPRGTMSDAGGAFTPNGLNNNTGRFEVRRMMIHEVYLAALQKLAPTISEFGWGEVAKMAKSPVDSILRAQVGSEEYEKIRQRKRLALDAFSAMHIILHEANHAIDKPWLRGSKLIKSPTAAMVGSFEQEEELREHHRGITQRSCEPLVESVSRENFKLLSDGACEGLMDMHGYPREMDAITATVEDNDIGFIPATSSPEDTEKGIAAMDDLWDCATTKERNEKYHQYFISGWRSYADSRVNRAIANSPARLSDHITEEYTTRHKQIYSVLDKLTKVLPMHLVVFSRLEEGPKNNPNIDDRMGGAGSTVYGTRSLYRSLYDAAFGMAKTPHGLLPVPRDPGEATFKLVNLFADFMYKSQTVFYGVAHSTGNDGKDLADTFPRSGINPKFIEEMKRLSGGKKGLGPLTPLEISALPNMYLLDTDYRDEYAKFLLNQMRK